MTSIGFIGLGHMGAPMARNLVEKGYEVFVYDLMPESMTSLVNAGAVACQSAIAAAQNRDFVVTMLPESRHVKQVYLGEHGLINAVNVPAFFIDCSTIDPDVSLDLHTACQSRGHIMLDAPVSGGVMGATNGTLTFMVGGESAHLEKARSLLEQMGKKIFHAGSASHGQAAKTCNNLMLGIHMLATCEAFVLAEKLGLEKEKLFEIASNSSGQSWSLTSYCPVPGPVPTSPANKDYAAGFAAAMMLKDLRQAQTCARNTGIDLPMGLRAQDLYDVFCQTGNAHVDFSGIIKYLQG